jgi:hypothetical protein
MKDLVLGSEEFLIRSQEMVEALFLQSGTEMMPEDGLEENHEGDRRGRGGTLTTITALMILTRAKLQYMFFLTLYKN